MIKRIARASVLATALVAVTAGAALGHECYVVNRSSQGNMAAGTNSNAWLYVDLPGLAMFLSDPSDPQALPALTESQLGYFVTRAQQLGVPSDIAIFLGGRPQSGGFTIAGDAAGFMKNGKGSDGSGMEHFFAAHIDSVITAYMEALEQPSGE